MQQLLDDMTRYRAAARRADRRSTVTRFIFLVVLCLTAYSCALDDGRVVTQRGEVAHAGR